MVRANSVPDQVFGGNLVSLREGTIRSLIAGACLLVSTAAWAVELRPIEKESADKNPAISSTQERTGVDSRLRPSQWSRITDAAVWKHTWQSHSGLISGDAAPALPDVDFEKSMVVAIIDRATPKPFDETHPNGVRLHQVAIDDEQIVLDYEFVYPTEDGPSLKPENAFGFFVLPRSELEMIIRRRVERSGLEISTRSRPDWERVARFGGLASTESGQASRANLQSIPPILEPPQDSQRLNIGFAHDPGAGHYDGVIGSPHDVWNFVDIGTTAVDYMRHSDAGSSTARLRVTRHDGEWGIAGDKGIFHGYIYHNCCCVDLEATLLDLQPGNYHAYVFAHGDAPNQNANIELIVGDQSVCEKATANDDTWDFRQRPYIEGVQYVRFQFAVAAGQQVRFVSHRDGSNYSMFNAIQLAKLP